MSETCSPRPQRSVRSGATEKGRTMISMAASVIKLDVQPGQFVQVGGARYEVVRDREGELSLEPAVTKTSAQLAAERGLKELSPAEVAELLDGRAGDGEG